MIDTAKNIDNPSDEITFVGPIVHFCREHEFPLVSIRGKGYFLVRLLEKENVKVVCPIEDRLATELITLGNAAQTFTPSLSRPIIGVN